MKYRVTDVDGNEFIFLADINEPLPSTGEPAQVNAINKTFVSETSPIPTYIPPGPPIVERPPIITPLDPIPPSIEIVGGFSEEIEASFDDQELFVNESILDQLKEQTG